MDLILNDKVAVVTGASKGIGLAVTKAPVHEGARVVAGALTTDSIVELERVTPVAVDLSDPAGPGNSCSALSMPSGGSTCSSTTSAPYGSASTVSSRSATTSSSGRCS